MDYHGKLNKFLLFLISIFKGNPSEKCVNFNMKKAE